MDAYRNIAAVYDAVTASFLNGPRRLMAETCAALGARRVLDLGCGTGVFVSMLRMHVDLAVGVDISPAMLRKTTARQTTRTSSPLFVLADGTALPFAANSFDLLTYALVLHESDSNPELLLRRGFSLSSLALVLEWRMPERNLDYPRSLWAHAVERLAGRDHYRHFRAFMRNGGLNGLAHRAGASIVCERPLKGGAFVLALLRAL